MAITVLSLNTAVDHILLVQNFQPKQIHRAERSGAFAGGKALNVARVVRQLGEPVRVIGFVGGTAAPFIRDRCDELGIEQNWVESAGETRTCVIVVDPASGAQTVVNEPGPRVTPSEVTQLRHEITRSVLAGDMLCMSGSAPPGMPDGFHAEIASELKARGAHVLGDLTGAELRTVANTRPWALAPNLDEATAAFGAVSGPIAMARLLAEQAEQALLTLGVDGVIYGSGETLVHLRPPMVNALNAVGSGDALAAGYLVGTSRGLPALDAVRLGMACGASNATRFEPGIGSRSEVEQLAKQVVVARSS